MSGFKRNESQQGMPLDLGVNSGEDSPQRSVSTAQIPRMDPNLLGRGHFFFGRTLGEGSYARVVHAKMKIENSPDFAIKIMEKSFIQKEKKVKFVLMEKEILSIVSHPFIIKLHYTFQDHDYLYMCMDLASGGELREVINRAVETNRRKGLVDVACDVATTRFYIGELIEALEYLHKLNIVHMDIKPENVLVTSSGHIKIADFGTALRDPETNEVGSIFVGTAEYVSPEILNADCDNAFSGDDLEGYYDEDNNRENGENRISSGGAGATAGEEATASQHHCKITRACDVWAVGCILFQLLCGRTPFGADTEYLIFMNINEHLDGTRPIEFPESIGETARQLVLALLVKDPYQRLGCRPVASVSASASASAASENNENGADLDPSIAVEESYWELKNHPFFEDAPWGRWFEVTPPYLPPAGGPISEKMFDGDNDDWMLEGDATPIQREFRAEEIGHTAPNNNNNFEIVRLEPAKPTPTSVKMKWLPFLNEGESQVFTGLVSKRVGLFAKRRQLILTDLPRLIYVDPETMEKKGEIPWTKQCPVSIHVISNSTFDVFCSVSKRSYHFTDCDGAGSLMWQELIGAMLEKQNDPTSK